MVSKKQAYNRLARQLATAYGSYRMGMTMSHFEKHYTRSIDIGEFWLKLAECIDKSMIEKLMSEKNRK